MEEKRSYDSDATIFLKERLTRVDHSNTAHTYADPAIMERFILIKVPSKRTPAEKEDYVRSRTPGCI